MTSPDDSYVPAFYKGYVDRVRDLDVIEALVRSAQAIKECLDEIDEEKGSFRYAEGKWTIKEMICHVMDAERIFAYRVLRFARADKTPLSGFDEKAYASEANAARRTVVQLNGELERLTMTSLDLFRSFTPEMFTRRGAANNSEVSVLNLGYIMSGHRMHHVAILKERYLSV